MSENYVSEKYSEEAFESRYISYRIKEEYKEWGKYNTNKYILLSGGTGTGKTHFITHELLDFAAENNKRILFLCNRKALRNQVESIIERFPYEKQDCIDVALYQGYVKWMKRRKFIINNYTELIYNSFMESLGDEENFFWIKIPAYYGQRPVIDRYGNVRHEYFNPNAGIWMYPPYNDAFIMINNLYAIDGYKGNPILPSVDITGEYIWEDGYLHYKYTFDKYSVFAKMKRISDVYTIEEYDYVVMDEIHYLIQDASFNFDTYDLFELLIQPKNENQTLIFMSGTSTDVKSVLERCIDKNGMIMTPNIFLKTYDVPADYSRIEPHIFTDEGELVDLIAEKIDEKWLIFVEAKERGKKLEDIIQLLYAARSPEKTCCFFCREPGIDKKLERLNEFGMFNYYDCIIATSILDNGVSFIHEDFRNIVIITWDDIEFLQMVGRKRFESEDDGLNLYVMERTQNRVKKHYKRILERIWIMKEFGHIANNTVATMANPYEKFRLISKYCNDDAMFKKLHGIVRFTPNGFKLNKLACYKYGLSEQVYRDILGQVNGNTSLAAHQFKLLGKDDFCVAYKEGSPFINSIRDFLNKWLLVEPMDLSKLREFRIELSRLISRTNDKSEFPIKTFGKNGCKVSFINRWLLGADLYYRIVSIQDKGKRNRNMYYVEEIPEEEREEAKNTARKEYISLYGEPEKDENKKLKATIVTVTETEESPTKKLENELRRLYKGLGLDYDKSNGS